jgi:hypothetical protein
LGDFFTNSSGHPVDPSDDDDDDETRSLPSYAVALEIEKLSGCVDLDLDGIHRSSFL